MSAWLQFRGVHEAEERGKQRQSARAIVIMGVLIALIPILCVPYLCAILFYQLCCAGRLTSHSRFVTLVACIFLSVAWVPLVNIVIWFTIIPRHPTTDVGREALFEDKINAFTPIGLFYVFCGWAFWVAVRHFSIADSYEAVPDRQALMGLKETILVPRNRKEEIPGVTTAFDLYLKLKEEKLPFVSVAGVVTIVFTAGIVSTSRFLETHTAALVNGTGSRLLYVFSTIDYCGIFFVFYSVLAAVALVLVRELRLLRRLSTVLPEIDRWLSVRTAERTPSDGSLVAISEHTTPPQAINNGSSIGQAAAPFFLTPTNMTHLRAWDEVRRVCVEELTSPHSVFQSFFTPTFGINALGLVGTYAYLVVRLLFLNGKFGAFTASLAVFAATMLCYMILILSIARSCRKEFKRQTSLITKLTFDVSRHLDRLLKYQLQEEYLKPTADLDPGRNRLLSSLRSMRTYMISNPPRLRVFSFELRYVRYGAVFFLLLNALLMFFAFVIALRSSSCRYRQTVDGSNTTINGTATPPVLAGGTTFALW